MPKTILAFWALWHNVERKGHTKKKQPQNRINLSYAFRESQLVKKGEGKDEESVAETDKK